MTRWVLLSAAVAIGAGVGIAAALLSSGSRSVAPATPMAADETWPAGARRAPDFRLRDDHGRPLSLRALRGRAAIVTFIDPVCRSLCPLEARVLGRVARDLRPAAPALVSISVNPPEDKAANFRLDASHWNLPHEWRWGLGSLRALSRVWRDYHIGVVLRKGEVLHTEAAYVIDERGYLRALFLYPFRAADVEHELRVLGGSSG